MVTSEGIGAQPRADATTEAVVRPYLPYSADHLTSFLDQCIVHVGSVCTREVGLVHNSGPGDLHLIGRLIDRVGSLPSDRPTIYYSFFHRTELTSDIHDAEK